MCYHTAMISSTDKNVSYTEALDKIILWSTSFKGCCESVPAEEALGRILAEDILADTDLPLVTNSSMDGYAVKALDISNASKNSPKSLKLTHGTNAGEPGKSISSLTCSYVATGAPLPTGSDAVVPIEEVDVKGDYVVFSAPTVSGQYVRPKGSEINIGETLVKAPEKITPFISAIACSAGLSALKVKRRPVVGVLTSGNELVMPFEKPQPWQVRNSNSTMLCQQIIATGGMPINFGIARDDFASSKEAFMRAAEKCDIIITSGGISMGKQDPFKALFFDDPKFEHLVYKVNMKPGKPLFFGRYDNKPVFGLPGNQISTAITFEIFVKPFIKKVLGINNDTKKLYLELASDSKNIYGRDFFKRGRIISEKQKTFVKPLKIQHSHMITGLKNADVIFLHPANVPLLKAGEIVETFLLNY